MFFAFGCVPSSVPWRAGFGWSASDSFVRRNVNPSVSASRSSQREVWATLFLAGDVTQGLADLAEGYVIRHPQRFVCHQAPPKAVGGKRFLRLLRRHKLSPGRHEGHPPVRKAVGVGSEAHRSVLGSTGAGPHPARPQDSVPTHPCTVACATTSLRRDRRLQYCCAWRSARAL